MANLTQTALFEPGPDFPGTGWRDLALDLDRERGLDRRPELEARRRQYRRRSNKEPRPLQTLMAFLVPVALTGTEQPFSAPVSPSQPKESTQ